MNRRNRFIGGETWPPQRALIFFAVVLLAGPGRTFADNGWEGRILSFADDNDATVGNDRHYTQGARITYFSRDDALPLWLQRFSSHVPAIGFDTQAQKLGATVGQEIYTPADLKTADLITNDRPYAGWLYGGAILQRRGPLSPACQAQEQLRLDLGVVGPESLAEAAQKATHHNEPRGWNNQLKTEPAFAFRYERRYRHGVRDEDGQCDADFVPSAKANAGTVDTSAAIGALLRFGYRIPNEFDAPHQATPLDYGTYPFTGAEGRYVVRNIFLDGNTFTSSHRIGKKPFVADMRVGLTVVLKNMELTAAHTFKTREFNGQDHADSYSTAMVTLKF